jgi:hypothetical protein
MARLLLFLLFLVIEILPVSVKLLQEPGNYEEILATATRQELNRAKWDLRGASGERNPLDAEVEHIWTRTRVMPIAGWKSTAETSVIDPHDDEATGRGRLDEVLRGLTDTRSANGYEGRQGGIERRYGDDDL